MMMATMAMMTRGEGGLDLEGECRRREGMAMMRMMRWDGGNDENDDGKDDG